MIRRLPCYPLIFLSNFGKDKYLTERFCRTPLSDAVFAETVRLVEDRQPADDKRVMRLVHDGGFDAEAGLIQRAWLLGNDYGLPHDMEQWKKLLRHTFGLLMLLAVVVGVSLAASMTVNQRTLNAPYALLLALGPHLFTLVLWLVSLLRPALPEFGSIGSLLLRGLARLPFRRGPHFWTMLHAAIGLLGRHRLLPWLSGIASHAFWAAALLAVLSMLALRFSFQAYQLTWETTILPPEFFIRFVQLSGWLPQQLGFPLPDTGTLLDPSAPGSDHRAWAWWLIGCIALYGLLPRLLLLALSWSVWRWRKQRVAPDFAQPYFLGLLSSLKSRETGAVVDPEQGHTVPAAPLMRQAIPGEAHTLAMIGYELPEESAWPPDPARSDAGSRSGLTERIAGSIQERNTLMQKLADYRPYLLLIACNPGATPDRGTASFIRDVAAHAVHCAIWLPPAPETGKHEIERWQAWLADAGLGGLPCLTRMSEFLAWAENKHD